MKTRKNPFRHEKRPLVTVLVAVGSVVILGTSWGLVWAGHRHEDGADPDVSPTAVVTTTVTTTTTASSTATTGGSPGPSVATATPTRSSRAS